MTPLSPLTDLLDAVEDHELSGPPAPQRHALEVALLWPVPVGAPLEPRAIAAGLLGTLHAV